MLFDIVLFSHNMPVQSGKIEINPFQEDQTVALNKGRKVTVCLACDAILPELKKDIKYFTDKKVRHPKRGLIKYFKEKEDRIPFLDGCHYTDYGQMKRSINDFFKNTLTWKSTCFFIICVKEDLLKKGLEDAISSNHYKEVITGKYENPLLNLINPAEASIDLRLRYMGNSEPCLLVRQMIAIAARHDFPVLVLGETGTGKEVVARAIHECSERKNQPFMAINCGAISPYLFESELFGHKKGAFTGAVTDKKGLWPLANGGTLFLDEIGDLSLDHQVKILKALEDGKVLPVGETVPARVNARIIAATNKNIESLISGKKNEFREDLYYRISTFIISTPPLSYHPEDIPELADKEWGMHCKKKLSQEALELLKTMTWPGNVRSLKHFIHRLYAMFGDVNISTEHIEVLQRKDMDNYIRSNCRTGIESDAGKDFEKVVMKMEYLLKAALCCDDVSQRKLLLNGVKEGLEGIIED